MGINKLLCHHLCAVTATHTLLVEKNPSKRRFSRRCRFAIVILIISVLFWHGLPNTGNTLYSTVGLPSNATQYDVVTHHSRMKTRFQKEGAPENAEDIKNAFQILLNDEKRKMYRRFGDLDTDVIGESNVALVAAALGLAYHALSSIICFALYGTSQMAFTRYVMMLYSSIAFALEMECRFVTANSIFKNIFYVNKLLPFQQIALLRGAAPAIALFLNAICARLFVDIERLSYFLWHSSVTTNRVILEKMVDVVDATNYIRSMGPKSTAHVKLNKSVQQQLNVSSEDETSEEKEDDSHASDDTGKIVKILESMDVSQRKKVAKLLEKSEGDNETEEAASWFERLKTPAIYFALFVLFKYYWKHVTALHVSREHKDGMSDRITAMPLFTDDMLKNQRGEVVPLADLAGKSVGLLFCDGDTPICLATMPLIIQFYNSINGQGLAKKIEIVYISCDESQEAFERNIRRMPWLHIDYNDRILAVLRNRYNVIDPGTEYGNYNAVEIPSIIVVNSNGGEIQRFPLYHGREQSSQTLRRWDWRNCLFA